MDVFPAIFPLVGLTIAIAGDGEAAEAKARLFEGAPARVVRITSAQALNPSSYAGARLAFIACEEAAAAAAAARAVGALVNVVDRPDLCDFNTPAIIDRGRVVGAVATAGAAPVLAAELRREIEALWPAGLGAVARLLAEMKAEIRAAHPNLADRRAWLRRLLASEAAAAALQGDSVAATAAARMLLHAPSDAGRRLLLIPPVSSDLLSLVALRWLSRADRLVIAGKVDPELLKLARRDAPRTPVAVLRAEDLQPGEIVVCIGQPAAFQALEPLERLPIVLPV